jgi:YfiH family protein
VEFGFPGRKPLDFDIFPFHSSSPAGAESLECRFLGGKSRRVVDLGMNAFLTVLDLTFCIYSLEKAVAEPLNGVTDSIVLNNIDTDTGDHDFMLQVKRHDQITFLHSEMLDRIPGIVHAFSTRRGERNDFSLGPVASPNPMVHINRARFLAAVGAAGWPLIKLKQVHSATIVDVDDTSAAGEAVEGDAAATSLREVMIGVQTADCVPILVAATGGGIVGAIHAGWRGTAAHIAERTIARLVEKYHVAPGGLVAAIGPHIGVCCYEVGEDVVGAISNPAAVERRAEWANPHLSLARATRVQLVAAGIPETQIETSSLCTRCRADLFHSYRRDGKRMGHMLSVIGMAL